jgi:hypothetical protein
VKLQGFIPLMAAIAVWWAFGRWNRRRRWFSTGEVIFWGAILLCVFQLAWLRYF